MTKGIGSSSLKTKKRTRSEEAHSLDLPIIKVPLQEKDSSVSAQTGVKAEGTVQSVAKQKAMSRKMSLLHQKEERYLF